MPLSIPRLGTQGEVYIKYSTNLTLFGSPSNSDIALISCAALGEDWRGKGLQKYSVGTNCTQGVCHQVCPGLQNHQTCPRNHDNLVCPGARRTSNGLRCFLEASRKPAMGHNSPTFSEHTRNLNTWGNVIPIWIDRNRTKGLVHEESFRAMFRVY